MARLYFVRHGQAASQWSDERDPGLSTLGKRQAQARADALAAQCASPLPIVSSPLLRCQETAHALGAIWNSTAVIEPRVREIPSPDMEGQARMHWLRNVMRRNWDALQDMPELTNWRADLLDYVAGCTHDSVVFSHFVAINVLVGAARNDMRVVCFRPANASCTIIDTKPDIRLITQGAEDESLVL